VTHSVSATHPMVFAQFMGTNPFVFPSGTLNHDTQPIPWASNHFYLGMPYMSSHLPSSVSSYVNPILGFGGMMPPFLPFRLVGVISLNQFPWLEVGILLPLDPILASLFQEQVLKWVVFLLITSHPSILFLLCWFLQTLFSWHTSFYPLVFHLGGVRFIVWETAFTKFLRLGETYILT
jgi:hypothetical protein